MVGVPQVQALRDGVHRALRQTAAWKAEFEERARLAYRDFRFEGPAVFAGIEPTRTHVTLFEHEF